MKAAMRAATGTASISKNARMLKRSRWVSRRRPHLITQLITSLAAYILTLGAAQAQVSIKCDVNGDRVIDQTDINIIKLSRNLPASGANDPRDVNGDGRITIADVNICTKRCTRPACSTINIAPTAKAGPDQTVALGEIAAIDGTASTDPEGSLLTYRWALVSRPAGSKAVLSSTTISTTTFTPDISGNYVIQLVVNDGIVDSAADEVVVSSTNSRPRANAGPDQTVPLAGTVTLNGAASNDPDGDAITFLWKLTSLPAGSKAALNDATIISPTFIADKRGTYAAQLLVNDGRLTSFPAMVNISTVNSVPVAVAGAAQTRLHGGTVVLNGAGSTDADGDPLTYQWALIARPVDSKAALSNLNTVNPSLTLDLTGNYVAQLIVNDGKVNSAPSTIAITDFNTAGVANAGPDQSVSVGSVVTLDGRASTDVDGDLLAYKWAIISAPSGSTAALSDPTVAMPTFVADVAGIFVIQLIVNDSFVNSAAATVSISAASSNLPPVANAGPKQFISCCGKIFLNGTASFDPEGRPLTYAWSVLSILPNTYTATLAGANTATPSFNAGCDCPDVITYVIQLIVSDGSLFSVPSTVTVRAGNNKPVANAGPNQNLGGAGLVFLNGGGSTDADGDPLTYSWSMISKPVASTALLLNPGTVNPSIITDLFGVYTFQLIVSDGFSMSVASTVTIYVGGG